MPRDMDKTRSTYTRSDWIFDWKLSAGSTLNSWLAIAVVSGLFVLLTLSLRVSIAEPVPGVVAQADILQLGQGRMGRLLGMEAKAKGPFPSRYDPTGPELAQELSQALAASTQTRVQSHVAQLTPLPETGQEVLRLAARGEPILPQRPLPAASAPAPRQPSLTPHLRALSGLNAQELPAQVPLWDKLPDERLAAKQWRFMVSIDRAGRVLECIAMEGGADPGAESIRKWLSGITFRNQDLTRDQRWIAVAVDFENQTGNHGIEPY
ncbi:MAG TPA: hypothetical protein VFY13_01545 [Luteolibacter sp.]|nr:hypothetical protein [Luteolibacter sp.]